MGVVSSPFPWFFAGGDCPESWLIQFRRVPRPTLINFSGGRTSGMMLALFLQAHGGRLPDDVKVIFANTGKERNETLDFVRDTGLHWGVEIIWLEYDPLSRDGHEFKVVGHNEAARDGEPFGALIGKRQHLPNAVARMCTEALKVRPARRYCRDVLGWPHYHSLVGIRYDEPRRVHRIRACGGKTRDGHTKHVPMADAGITGPDVVEFWRHQSFDLGLPVSPEGKSPHGNCDLCFLKGAGKIRALIREDPARADWWIAQEERQLNARRKSGATFRAPDRPNYRKLREQALAGEGKTESFDDLGDIECNCTD